MIYLPHLSKRARPCKCQAQVCRGHLNDLAALSSSCLHIPEFMRDNIVESKSQHGVYVCRGEIFYDKITGN